MKNKSKTTGLLINKYGNFQTSIPVNKNLNILKFILVALISSSTIIMFASFLKIKLINFPMMFLMSLLFTSIFVGFSAKNKVVKLVCALVLAFIVIKLGLEYKAIAEGFFQIGNRYLDASAYKELQPLYHHTYKTEIRLCAITVLLILSLGLCCTIYFKPSFLGTFMLTFPFFELGAYWGFVPNYLTFFIMLLSWFICLCMQNATIHKVKLSKTSKLSLNKHGEFEISSSSTLSDNSNCAMKYSVILCSFATAGVLICSLFIGERSEKIDNLRRDIKYNFENFEIEKIPEYVENLKLEIKPNSKSDVKIGAVAGGMLGGGDIKFKNKTMLEVELEILGGTFTTDTLYLKGFVGGEYTGHSWKELDKKVYKNNSLFTNKNPYGFQDYNTKAYEMTYANNYFYNSLQKRISIKNINASTKYMYMPYYTMYNTITNADFYYDLYAQPKNKNYTFNYYTGIDQSDTLKAIPLDYFNYFEDGAYYDYGEFVRENYMSYDLDVISKAYNDIVKMAYNNFVDGGGYNIEYDCRKDGIIDVYEILDYKIGPVYTPESETRYDLTIAQYVADAIAVYFQQYYPYSLEVGTTPKDKDFVKYFLEEQKAGSCTYFASAGVLLMRAFGFPARYVEGAAITSDEFKISEENPNVAVAEVKDKSLHAWCEIFIKNIGWIPVEFTPGYVNGENPNFEGFTSTVTNEIINDFTTTTTRKPETTVSTTFSDYHTFMEPVETTPATSKDSINTTTKVVSNSTTTSGNKENKDNKADYDKIFGIIIKLVILVFVILVTLSLWRMLYLRRRRAVQNSFEDKNRNVAVTSIYKELIKIIGIFGKSLNDYKSDISNIDDVVNFLLKKEIEITPDEFYEFVELAVEADMSVNEVAEESYEFAKNTFDNISKQIYDKFSFIKKLWAKYFKFVY